MPEFLTKFFGSPALLPVLLFLTAAGCVVFAVFLLCVNEGNLEKMQRISRWKIPGLFLGIFVLAWCIPHSMPILPDSLHKFLFPLLVVFAVASWFVLDHRFARALGGYMILAAHLFLRENYAVRELASPVLSVLFLLFGTMGIFLCGLPYRLRDVVRLQIRPRYRFILPVFLFVFAAAAFREWFLVLRLDS